MKALRSFLRGVKAVLTSPFLVGTVWLINLAFAFVVGAAFYKVLQEYPPAYSGLVPDLHAFDWVAWVDLKQAEASVFRQLTLLSGWVVFGYLVLSTFLSGGILEILDSQGRRFSLEVLFGGGARRFRAFFFLLVIELAVLWGIDLLWNDWFGKWLNEMWTKDLNDEVRAIATTLATGAIFVLFFYVVRTAFDYARVRTVVEGRSSVILAVFAGWRFCLAHPVSVTGLAITVSVFHAAIVAGFFYAEPLLGGSGMMQILFLLLLHQGYVLLRLGMRIVDYSAKIELVRMVQFAPASTPYPEPQAAPGGSLEEPSIQDLLGTTGYSGTETDSVPEDSVESLLPEDSEPDQIPE